MRFAKGDQRIRHSLDFICEGRRETISFNLCRFNACEKTNKHQLLIELMLFLIAQQQQCIKYKFR
eukprot:m.178466 g.178466  ORF g.178466 m.178466 type:complete len:65 (+) comp15467_c0_seq2:3551-3745(+)